MSDPSAVLAGKSAVVTAAGSGIGAAVARSLSAAGARVLVADKDFPAATTVANEIGGEPAQVDLGDPEAAAPLGEGRDVVVNLAGEQQMSAMVQEYPAEMFSRMLRATVESPFRIVRTALPGMYERGWGRVVNISSVHGLRASPLRAAYVTAKHGLEGLSKVIAAEGARYGVTSNCVSPGYVRTPLVEAQITEQARTHRVPEEEIIEDMLLGRTPVKRLVETEEVAALVTWLCGPMSRSVNGSSYAMDGGWSAH